MSHLQTSSTSMVNSAFVKPGFDPDPGGSVQHSLLRKSTTHLAKNAVFLQDAPHHMLTFSQLMSRLAPLMPEERKSLERNIRVCLSSYRCFVKVPTAPGATDSKKNYWKLNWDQIIHKMVRRHFKAILELFPQLTSRMKMENIGAASNQRTQITPFKLHPVTLFKSR